MVTMAAFLSNIFRLILSSYQMLSPTLVTGSATKHKSKVSPYKQYSNPLQHLGLAIYRT